MRGNNVKRRSLYSVMLELPLWQCRPSSGLLCSRYPEQRVVSTKPLASMQNRKLHNYLRTHRKRTGLSQREVAFLVSASRGGAHVSRHEKRHRLPPLRTALAYESLYGIPVAKLFAGVYVKVARMVKGRLVTLHQEATVPQKRGIEARLVAKKLAWLKEQHHL